MLNITKNGKTWERLNSLWVIWAFIPTLHWIPFFWIGARAKQKKWVLFGWIYFVFGFISVLIAAQEGVQDIVIIDNICACAYFISWIAAIIHVFIVRKEYLILREMVVENQELANHAYRQKIQNKVNGIHENKISQDFPTDSLDGCKAAVENYLGENKSTPFFSERLTAVAGRIDTFSSRYNHVKNMIIERFGPNGLSYGKFAAPVEAMRGYLINMTNKLVSRMVMFDETEYSIRIEEFTKANRISEAADYTELEQEYKDYAEKTLAAFDDAILKIDKLMLEISKINNTDVEGAMDIMNALDSAIKDTQFYK